MYYSSLHKPQEDFKANEIEDDDTAVDEKGTYKILSFDKFIKSVS